MPGVGVGGGGGASRNNPGDIYPSSAGTCLAALYGLCNRQEKRNLIIHLSEDLKEKEKVYWMKST